MRGGKDDEWWIFILDEGYGEGRHRADLVQEPGHTLELLYKIPHALSLPKQISHHSDEGLASCAVIELIAPRPCRLSGTASVRT
ncbi:hypothetical protein Slala02_57750 [Streptomyces lavendulae subsp. lavendulae]|nr:hypothetical protein Slala01_61160 [Streptomyces lavendulae subsp. lavendulae]GLX29955.1 hypothetical protein Slala02_57750 [Streptomyces lavendulae subsp. lavendulae]